MSETEDRVMLTVRMPVLLRERLKGVAWSHRLSLNEYCLRVLKEAAGETVILKPKRMRSHDE